MKSTFITGYRIVCICRECHEDISQRDIKAFQREAGTPIGSLNPNDYPAVCIDCAESLHD